MLSWQELGEQLRQIVEAAIRFIKARRLPIEQSVVDNLIEAAIVAGEVSPVDIGIGLLVLSELYERQGARTIAIRDYQFHSGAEGLLLRSYRGLTT